MGGSGNDTIEVTGRHNTINGNNGNDKIVVSGANNSIFGGNDDDNITAKGNYNKIYGGYGDDKIRTGEPSYGLEIFGSFGLDDISVSTNASTISGNEDRDLIRVTGHNNTVKGNEGLDRIIVNGYDNRIFGGSGDDTIIVTSDDERGSNATIVRGGPGNDIITYRNNSGGQIHTESGWDRIDLCASDSVRIVYDSLRQDGLFFGVDLIECFDGDLDNVIDLRALNLSPSLVFLFNSSPGEYTLNAGLFLTVHFTESQVSYDDILI